MDKVKLYAQERLDLDDARALQTLVYDYVQEAIGGLLGHIRGALSVPSITQTENGGAPYIELSAFQFVTSRPVFASSRAVTTPSAGTAYHQHKSIVVSYDPNEETSTQISIDTARAYYQDYVGAYLWARPLYRDSDTATRVQWSVAQASEVQFSDETREAQRVEFVVQTSEPAYATGEAKWAAIAELIAWSDGDNPDSLASWQFLSAFEHEDTRAWATATLGSGDLERNDQTLDNLVTTLAAYPMNQQNQSFRGFGLADQVAFLRFKVAQMQGHGAFDPSNTTSAVNWYAQSQLSLHGAYANLQTLNNQRTTGHVCIASGFIRASLIQGQEVSYVFNANQANKINAVRPSPTRSNRVCIELDAALLLQNWRVLHVSVSQLYNPKDNGDGTFDYNRVNFQVDTSIGSELNDDTYYRLDDYSTTGGRGINLELLALEQSNEEAVDLTYNATNHADLIGTETGNTQLVDFTIAVFAVHDDQF